MRATHLCRILRTPDTESKSQFKFVMIIQRDRTSDLRDRLTAIADLTGQICDQHDRLKTICDQICDPASMPGSRLFQRTLSLSLSLSDLAYNNFNSVNNYPELSDVYAAKSSNPSLR